MEMSGKPVHKLRPPPVYDYSSAIAKAVEWLGDRYFLRPADTRRSVAKSTGRVCNRSGLVGGDGAAESRAANTKVLWTLPREGEHARGRYRESAGRHA